MAMTAAEKRAFRTALGSKKHADIIIAIIDSGSATAVADATEKALAVAMGNKSLSANVITALETGSALSAAAKTSLANVIGKKRLADSIITQIDAIT